MSDTRNSNQLVMPKSVAHWSDPFTVAALIIGVYLWLRSSTISNNDLAIVICLALTLYLCTLEVLRTRWRDIPRPIVPFSDVLKSAAVKWVGSMTGLCLMLLCYWLFQEYQRPQYQPIFYALPLAMPFIPAIIFLMHLFTEWRLGPSGSDGRDLGLFTLLRWKEMKLSGIQDELLAWFIKGFFFTINFSELPKTIQLFRGKEEVIFNLPWPQMQPMIIWMIYCLIIASICPGYMFSARIFGTHIRNIAKSWFAFTFTLLCYAPFNGSIMGRWFFYKGTRPEEDWNKPWVSNFPDNTEMLYFLGGLMIASELIHYLGEGIFGLRASNLSNRGIITNGVFRYCKHPVFASKCFTWLFMWLPFMQGDTLLECLRLSLGWVGVCCVFGARCWAEERVLAEDKVYVAYALWVDRHGIFSWAGRMVPLLQFEWRLRRWIRRGEISRDVVPDGFVV